MIQQGQVVRHRRFGVGIVRGAREVDGPQGRATYYLIDLASGEKLMVPVDQSEMISTLDGSRDAILEALAGGPQALADDFRERQKEVQDRIDSGDLGAIAEAVRDLVWRDGHSSGLSSGDKQLMLKAKRLLAGAFAVPPALDLDAALEGVETLVQQMTGRWALAE